MRRFFQVGSKKNEEREAIINEFSRKIATELWVSAASKQYKTKAFTDALKNLLNNPTLMESFLMMNMSLVTIICDLDTNKYDSLGVSMKACIETWYDEHSEEKRKKSQRDNRMIESPQKLNIKPLSENNQNLFTPAVKKLFATNQNIQTQGADFKNNL